MEPASLIFRLVHTAVAAPLCRVFSGAIDGAHGDSTITWRDERACRRACRRVDRPILGARIQRFFSLKSLSGPVLATMIGGGARLEQLPNRIARSA